jgi:hypothetical protein
VEEKEEGEEEDEVERRALISAYFASLLSYITFLRK